MLPTLELPAQPSEIFKSHGLQFDLLAGISYLSAPQWPRPTQVISEPRCRGLEVRLPGDADAGVVLKVTSSEPGAPGGSVIREGTCLLTSIFMNVSWYQKNGLSAVSARWASASTPHLAGSAWGLDLAALVPRLHSCPGCTCALAAFVPWLHSCPGCIRAPAALVPWLGVVTPSMQWLLS